MLGNMQFEFIVSSLILMQEFQDNIWTKMRSNYYNSDTTDEKEDDVTKQALVLLRRGVYE
jgi:hypothetical protein